MKRPEETKADRTLQLQQRLQGNHQRNLRRKYLDSLPDDLCRDPSGCDFLPISEFTLISERFLVRPEGYGRLAVKPDDYLFAEFAWRHKVLEEVQKSDGRHDSQPAFFWPTIEGPIYRVEFGWVRSNFDRLFSFNDRAAVIAIDSCAGMIVDEYCGYLPNDYNPDEVVYELGVWGFGILPGRDL